MCGSQNRMEGIIMPRSRCIAFVTTGIFPIMCDVDNLDLKLICGVLSKKFDYHDHFFSMICIL